MRQRDLKQISQLRKLREDEEEKKLMRARAALREAEAELHRAEQERDRMREHAMQEERRQWQALAYSDRQKIGVDNLEHFYEGIDERKSTLVTLRKKVLGIAKVKEERQTDINEAQKMFIQAQRNKDRWQNLRDKLDEERIRHEEILMEEENSEIRLKPPVQVKHTKE